MEQIDELKIILREHDIPFFQDHELAYYLYKNKDDLNATVYECALIKAEDSSLSVSGLQLPDTSAYFRRLATRYRPNNSGVLNLKGESQ